MPELGCAASDLCGLPPPGTSFDFFVRPTRQRSRQIGREWCRAMTKRKLLKVQDRRKVFDIPADEDTLIRRYSLSPADRLEIELRRRERRTLPDRVPVTHLSQANRRLIFGQGRPDRRLYEIATLAALRDRLRSADIWVDGSRSFRPIDEHLMPRSTFTTMKEEDRLGLGVQGDGAQWLAEARQMLDFNLKRLAHRARSGKLEGVRLEAGTLIVTPTAGEVPVAAEELNARD